MEITGTIERFKSIIHEKERETFGAISRFDARFPMVTVFVGDKTREEYSSLVRTQLQKMWPAYDDIFKYYVISDETTETTCWNLELEQLDIESLRTQIKELFEDESHFANKLTLVVNYVFDTQFLTNAELINQTMCSIKNMKEMLAFPKQQTNAIFLLNEQLGEELKAAEIKDKINDLYYGTSGELKSIISNLILVSNKAFTGKYLNIERESKIIADVITLYNDDDAKDATSLYIDKVKAVGFNNVEKPVEDISKISVIAISENTNKIMTSITEEINMGASGNKFTSGNKGKEIPQIKKIIDDFVCELPEESVLEKFPRNNSEDVGPVGTMTSDDFNKLTMGAWDFFIVNRINEYLEVLTSESKKNESLRDAFKAYLEQTLSIFEIRDIKGNHARIDSLYKNIFGESNLNNGVGNNFLKEDVVNSLKNNLEKSNSFKSLFVSVLEELSSDVNELFDGWETYMKSINKVGLGKDNELEQYYSGIVTTFFRTNYVALVEQIKKIRSIENMKEFLDMTFIKLVSNNPVYGYSFEDELKERLVENADSKDVQNNILRALSKNNEQYFNPTHQVLSGPVLSTVFIKKGSNIADELKSNMSKSTVFIDTSNGESIDALQIYSVDRIHLAK